MPLYKSSEVFVPARCVMFRDKWIIRFFKFPFCGDFSLHLHKMVKEISRNITRAENFQRHVSETR